jgi:hypothetical protein
LAAPDIVNAAPDGSYTQEVPMVASMLTILDTPTRQIKAYQARNPGEADTLFASDAHRMSKKDWRVQSHDWTAQRISPTQRFVWGMFAGSGGGTLTVTYAK